MSEMSHEEAIDTFQSITGADAPTAEHVLEAHAWDLSRGINFFLEGGIGVSAREASVPLESAAQNGHGRQDTASEKMLDVHEDIEDDLDSPRSRRHTKDQGPSLPPRSGRSSRRRDAVRFEVDEDDDDSDYKPIRPSSSQKGMARGGRGNRTTPKEKSKAELNLSSDTDDDNDLAIVDNASTRSPQTRRRRAEVSSHRLVEDNDEDELDGSLNCMPNQFQSVGLFGPGGRFSDMPPLNGHSFMERRSQDLDIPGDIDVEEAKMLEAAMMGIPYRGRVPDFAAEAQRPSMPEDPEVIQQRLLREEQDQAYQNSLIADMEKKSAAEAQERAEEEQRWQEEQEKQIAEQAQQDYERDIEHKMLNLPEEPAVGTQDAITILIRTPKGQRYSRRFMTSDSVKYLFWFADVSGAPEIKPGTYRLVTQFPRKVLTAEKRGTMFEAGLTQKQEGLFLEAL